MATADRKNMTVGSKVLKIDLENKKVSQVLDMDTLLKSVYAVPKRKAMQKIGSRWIRSSVPGQTSCYLVRLSYPVSSR